MRLHGTRRVVLKLRVPKTDKSVVTRAAENCCTNWNHPVCLPLRVLAKFLPISRVIWSGIGTGNPQTANRKRFQGKSHRCHPCGSFSYCRLLPPRKTAKLFEANGMVGRGGGDRTKSDVETAQVIDFIKREKRQKHRIRPSEVHGRYTGEASSEVFRWSSELSRVFHSTPVMPDSTPRSSISMMRTTSPLQLPRDQLVRA
jgi:hypothetical protein